MRSCKQIESAIADIKHQIEQAQKLQTLATFAGHKVLRSLLEDARAFYDKAIKGLDENDPALSREYAKHKACLMLIENWIARMNESKSDIDALQKQLLALNGELQEVHDEVKRREKEKY